MTKLNIHEAKTHLSKYLLQVQEGQSFTLCKNGIPVALLTPLPLQNQVKRKRFGLAKSMGKVSEKFFQPLSETELPGLGL